jgi:hypothetical protein
MPGVAPSCELVVEKASGLELGLQLIRCRTATKAPEPVEETGKHEMEGNYLKLYSPRSAALPIHER